MGYGKKNHVSLNWLDYNLFLLGVAKVGKSSTIYEACKKTVGDDGYLFLEIGQERGADAIEGINYVNCPAWDMGYDEVTNSIGFATVVDDIIQNKNTEYKDLKVVIWDTYDQLINLAEAKTIELHNAKAEKSINTINSAFGGFGKGVDKAIELMLDKMARLKAVGVSTIIIGHVKVKDVTDVVSGETYQTLTSDQTQKYYNAMAKNMHFIGLAYIDREIAHIKTGKKILKDGNKIDEMVNKVQGEVRKIKFRDDSYCIDCGTRFKEIDDEIPLNADALIDCLNRAILAEQKKSTLTLEEAKKEQIKQDKAIAKKAEENSKKEKSANLSESLKELVKSLDKDKQKVYITWMQNHSYSVPDIQAFNVKSEDDYNELVKELTF